MHSLFGMAWRAGGALALHALVGVEILEAHAAPPQAPAVLTDRAPLRARVAVARPRVRAVLVARARVPPAPPPLAADVVAVAEALLLAGVGGGNGGGLQRGIRSWLAGERLHVHRRWNFPRLLRRALGHHCAGAAYRKVHLRPRSLPRREGLPPHGRRKSRRLLRRGLGRCNQGAQRAGKQGAECGPGSHCCSGLRRRGRRRGCASAAA
mmetsp:Transcript_15601/g.42507  ORF Transcript_15601/g.42507 Transcript_15601/m.42507 type:complete len:209 (-) Transcript_15601:68-694(-)